MRTDLKAPKAGEREILFPPVFGKTLYRQSFSYGEGRTEEYVMWGYEKQPPAIIMPITVTGEVVAVHQFRQASNRFIIEFPGGVSVSNTEEPLEDIAKRELLEETGYQAGEIRNLNIQSWFEPAYLNVPVSLFLGLGCVKVREPDLDSTETMETLAIPIEEWYGMIFRGEIVDNKTVALSLYALPHLGIELKFFDL
jgi:ADP-ribose pyrophosphatase